MPKGIYDRATSAWKPRAQREYASELVERVRELYDSGLTIAEVQRQVPGCKVQRVMERHGIPRRPAVPRDQTGSNNASWKGDSASYQALHLRVQAVRGKPDFCARCDSTDPQQSYEWANVTGHYEDPSDYIRLCVPCHRQMDAALRRLIGRRLSPPRGGEGDV